MRDRLLADEKFRIQLLDWLHACHTGDFSSGTMDDISSRVDEKIESEAGGARVVVRDNIRDPATTLPSRPPEHMSDAIFNQWHDAFGRQTDEIVFFSNRHDPAHRKGCKRPGSDECRARFPHVTCLLSGTQVKAVVAYVTDYVTKSNLNTHSFFETVRTVLDRNQEQMASSVTSRSDTARSVITKIVNALSVLQETGGPAACAYLLGHPDHYTNHSFRVVYWQSYLKCAIETGYESDQTRLGIDAEGEDVVVGRSNEGVVGLHRVDDYVFRPEFFTSMSMYQYLSSSDVRKLRKCERFENETHPNQKLRSDEDADGEDSELQSSSGPYQYLEGHPLRESHGVFQVGEDAEWVLNFVGGVLPRKDRGDREEYCMVMLMLFKPGGWRSGKHLRIDSMMWEQTFEATEFPAPVLKIMHNMNLLYECLDARDDYAAQRRIKENTDSMAGFLEHEGLGSGQRDDGLLDYTEEDLIFTLQDNMENIGKRTAHHRQQFREMQDMLTGLTSGAQCAVGIEPSRNYLPPDQDVARLTASQWMEKMQKAKSDALARKNGSTRAPNMTVPQAPPPSVGIGNAIVREVSLEELNRLLTHSLDVSRGPQDAQIELFTTAVSTFNLNLEQTRAFFIVAYHLHHHLEEPLRMYLGGMGGTGKSTVIASLQYFLVMRDEAYRFEVLGPTGTSACIVDGMTYHSMLGFGRQSESTVSALEKVRGRLQHVELVFIDEVSMISCSDLYKISAQLAKAFSEPTQAFGGKNIILAGDFAQLPPAGCGQLPLYTESIGSWSDAATVSAQKNAIGKSLWHAFTTVVILRQNMRQRGMSAEDIAFKHALSNLRYKSCTPDDLALLRGRVIRPSCSERTLDAPRFKDVSIITPRNAHRDAINAFNIDRFAADHGKPLHHFHSIDTYAPVHEGASVRKTQRRMASVADPIRKLNTIDPHMQEILWRIPPSLTDHHAGILTLCEGMPVLLKHNEATEICATNGAEGVVVGWDADVSSVGHEILNVLFVRLTHPPRPVRIDGLPVNVIPLGRNRKRIRCLLPSDQYITIWRDQVSVLWNFAMTDFGAQGRTRESNVCHLKYARNHQSIYTSLSRSSSLLGTLIIGDLNESKMTGGASGGLRRELRELEILDDITKMRMLGTLPGQIHGHSRGQLIQSFQQFYGKRYVPRAVHSALNWQHLPDAELNPPAQPPPWTLIHHKKSKLPPTAKSSAATRTKSNPPQPTTAGNPRWMPPCTPTVCQAPAPTSHTFDAVRMDRPPVSGPIWDNRNWSCAYDATLMIIFNVFTDYGESWGRSLAPDNLILVDLRQCLNILTYNLGLFETVRNRMRDQLSASRPATFPRRGTEVTSITDVMQTLFECPSGFAHSRASCATCHTSHIINTDISRNYVWCLYRSLWPPSVTQHHVTPTDCIDRLLTGGTTVSCTGCHSTVPVITTLTTAPPLIVLEVVRDNLIDIHVDIELGLSLRIGMESKSWALVGMVYAGSNHFTSRFISRAGDVWYHDGATLARSCTAEGTIVDSTRDLHTAYGRQASHLVTVPKPVTIRGYYIPVASPSRFFTLLTQRISLDSGLDMCMLDHLFTPGNHFRSHTARIRTPTHSPRWRTFTIYYYENAQLERNINIGDLNWRGELFVVRHSQFATKFVNMRRGDDLLAEKADILSGLFAPVFMDTTLADANRVALHIEIGPQLRAWRHTNLRNFSCPAQLHKSLRPATGCKAHTIILGVHSASLGIGSQCAVFQFTVSVGDMRTTPQDSFNGTDNDGFTESMMRLGIANANVSHDQTTQHSSLEALFAIRGRDSFSPELLRWVLKYPLVEVLTVRRNRNIKYFLRGSIEDHFQYGVTEVPRTATWGTGWQNNILCIYNHPLWVWMVGEVVHAHFTDDIGQPVRNPMITINPLREVDFLNAWSLLRSTCEHFEGQTMTLIASWEVDFMIPIEPVEDFVTLGKDGPLIDFSMFANVEERVDTAFDGTTPFDQVFDGTVHTVSVSGGMSKVNPQVVHAGDIVMVSLLVVRKALDETVIEDGRICWKPEYYLDLIIILRTSIEDEM
ncbi:hypothetical protein A0H81_02091 [Grifola frondosa]|uniref:ATP-dependent DNA helicase n=1 Tax=Grifola frondosa TaxID=5627 RepID=A0A1C7MMB9_GRIFR|nr:hypothetical protein A0H81_02091 [Grifola frondosa]